MSLHAGAAALLTLLLAAGASAHEPADGEAPSAPADASGQWAFTPPAAGSYELPPIQRVDEYELLDESGRPAALPGLDANKEAALVAFVYRHCVDGSGCPMSLAVLKRLDHELAARPELAARVRLLTVSFDPARDTPERMAELRHHMRPESDWQFLTAGSPEAIAPVLADYGQDSVALRDVRGDEVGVYRHVLKVFLVDRDRSIRNIYSAGFLSAELLLVDLETLVLEAGEPVARATLGSSRLRKNPSRREARAFGPIAALRNLSVVALQRRFRALRSGRIRAPRSVRGSSATC